MRKIITVGLVVLVVIFFTSFSFADGELIISGYEPKKFAVDNNIERQINETILAIEKDPSMKSDSVLKVLVTGSADVTGISAENDPLSKNRAEPVAAKLSHRLPLGTVINIVPRGDTENKRQVRVEWNFVPIPKTEPAVVPAPAPITPSPAERTGLTLSILTVFAVMLIVIYVVLALRKKKALKYPESFRESKNRWVEAEVDGKKYSVPIEVRDGKFISPFKTLEDPTKSLFRSDYQGIKKAVKGCMTDARYATQKEELIKRGVIKIS